MYKNTYIHNPLVSENNFRTKSADLSNTPSYDKSLLPQPYWQGHDSVIACYDKAWEIAFKNIKSPTNENGFVASYIDTAYNDNIFMWDSSFMCMFGVYGRRVFNFQTTLDNFYRKQHPDGFICREISQLNGQDLFQRYDPVSTGPNIMPWAEWEYYQRTGDISRLEEIFPVLVSYHQWLMSQRTWKDGTYWSSGWGTGMDNQPRLPSGYHQNYSHGHMTWLDTNLQQIISGKVLMAIGEEIERWQEIEPIIDETEHLIKFINDKMFCEKTNFYYDLLKDGSKNNMIGIGAYWALLADIVPKEKIEAFIEYLKDEKHFKRPHPIPSLSFSNSKYKEKGRYWQGGVWAPTNYMVLKGLNKISQFELAHEIAKEHIQAVTKIFEDTGTLWENYAPEHIEPATPAKPDFVGWSGLTPISILFEDVFGLKPDVKNNTLNWHIQLNEKFGVKNYPFGKDNIIDLHFDPSLEKDEQISIQSKHPVNINLIDAK